MVDKSEFSGGQNHVFSGGQKIGCVFVLCFMQWRAGLAMFLDVFCGYLAEFL